MCAEFTINLLLMNNLIMFVQTLSMLTEQSHEGNYSNLNVIRLLSVSYLLWSLKDNLRFTTNEQNNPILTHASESNYLKASCKTHESIRWLNCCNSKHLWTAGYHPYFLPSRSLSDPTRKRLSDCFQCAPGKSGEMILGNKRVAK